MTKTSAASSSCPITARQFGAVTKYRLQQLPKPTVAADAGCVWLEWLRAQLISAIALPPKFVWLAVSTKCTPSARG